MKKHITKTIALFAPVFLLAPFEGHAAETRYITDQLHVPVRAGKGNEFRIVHRGLPSGTEMELLEDAPDEGWARIVTSGGTEGWVRRQYLVSEPVAQLKLAEAKARLQRFEKLQGNLGGEVRRLEDANNQLTAELETNRQKANTLDKQLRELRAISEDAVNLHKVHQELLEKHELLKQKFAMSAAEVERLKKADTHKWYMYGGLTMAGGFFLALIAPLLPRRKRRHSEWGN